MYYGGCLIIWNLNFYKHKYQFYYYMYKKSGKQTKHKYEFFRLTIDSVIWYSVTLPLCIRIISLQQRNQFGITRSIFAIVNTVYTLRDNRIGFARSHVSHKFAPKDSIKPWFCIILSICFGSWRIKDEGTVFWKFWNAESWRLLFRWNAKDGWVFPKTNRCGKCSASTNWPGKEVNTIEHSKVDNFGLVPVFVFLSQL